MTNVLAPILDQLAKIWARVDLVPVIRWGTVTQAAPLRVRLDGDADPLALTPTTLLTGLQVGARVLCVEQHRRVIVAMARQPRGPHRGPAAVRAATPSTYWEFWQDTDGDQALYVGNKTGGWRRFSGTDVAAAGAWARSDTSGTVIFVGRTVTFTLPTVLEANETLIVSATNIGTGYGSSSMAAIIRNPTNTVITVRQMQMASTTQQSLSIAWHIVQS